MLNSEEKKVAFPDRVITVCRVNNIFGLITYSRKCQADSFQLIPYDDTRRIMKTRLVCTCVNVLSYSVMSSCLQSHGL